MPSLLHFFLQDLFLLRLSMWLGPVSTPMMVLLEWFNLHFRSLWIHSAGCLWWWPQQLRQKTCLLLIVVERWPCFGRQAGSQFLDPALSRKGRRQARQIVGVLTGVSPWAALSSAVPATCLAHGREHALCRQHLQGRGLSCHDHFVFY